MKNKLTFVLLASGIVMANTLFAQGTTSPLVLQYDKPAAVWESEALPLGNGNIGAMVFGDVPTDILQINEHSLWSGGPGKNPAYNGGHLQTAATNRQNLLRAQEALQKDMTAFSETKQAYIDESGKVVAQNYPENALTRGYVNLLKGTKNDFGSYQTLGNINIAYTSVTLPEIVSITGDCDNPTGGEKLTMLFDGSVNTKWYSDTGFKGFPCYVAWEYASPFQASAYTLTSGNDVPDRDPKSWKLYGSNDGQSYTLIDTRTNITFPGRTQSVRFALANTVTYKYFKYEITATAGSNGTTAPQLSEIALENAAVTQFPAYTNYRRELDIDRSVAKVSYTQSGVNYTREYFISHPDNVLVIRLTADKPGTLSRNIWFTSSQTKATFAAAAPTGTKTYGTVSITGQPSDQQANGLKFAQELQVFAPNGTITAANGKLTVENADEILIISSAATNYRWCMDDTYNYFTSENPLTKAENAINAVSSTTYPEILNKHVQDYQSLYNRMSLRLANATNTGSKTTDKLLAGYKNNTNTVAENRYLEELYFQFGRYLLISSSRKGSLPANLQGIWAEGLTPPWAADYHTNINIQMNYWLAEQTNLADCHFPAIDYVKSLVPRGKYTAKHYFGENTRGWVDFHENNIWGNTAPATSDAFYFPAAAGWLCQDIWEYYLFNQDKEFLQEYYPVLLDAALFWVDNLWRDTRDGTLVASPSYSPEHGPYSMGSACDQGIITELFDMTLKAYSILKDDLYAPYAPEIVEIMNAKNKLAGPQIGLAGQFMEWKDETSLDISGDGGHRHVNHLFWLHPGSQIVAGRSAQDNLYAEAMKKTLNTRGDGGTGWSKAWKINFWARLRDGNRSHKLLGELLKESTLNNLFDTHPPFQIDGNFGATAGMTEMLVQSQGDYIELLPALPDDWATGSFKGIKARGNFELSADWSDKKLQELKIRSNSGTRCWLKYSSLPNYEIVSEDGSLITSNIVNNDKVFDTTAGTTYIVRQK